MDASFAHFLLLRSLFDVICASRPLIIGNCLEFIRLRRPHIHPTPTILKQLARAAQYLNLNPNDQSTTFQQRWIIHAPGMSVLETLLHNTFMNGHAIPVYAPGNEAAAAAFEREKT